MTEPEAGTLVGERFGKYELLSLIAVGGTAEIYLARIGGEAGFEKFVVIKCLLDHLASEPEYVDMFLDEARLGAQLDHSNIVQTLELGQHEGRYFLAMEYLAGMSLATMTKLATQRLPTGLPLEQSLALCAQACAGLHYSHERATPAGQPLNIIHRDVSPQNLVVSFEGVLKLVDFGIAKAELRKTKTRTGTIKGKFAYMSPEQCLDKPIDRRTDIFALGTVLHELVTGQRLFKRDNAYDTYQAIVSGKIPRPSEVNPIVSADIDTLIMRALAYDPRQRYPTAEAFGEALHEALHKRGRLTGAGATARFIDKIFAEEVDLHNQRMRELVSSGRAQLQDITWNAPVAQTGPSVRHESEEELDFDSAPPSFRGGVKGDFEDDQPTRLDDSLDETLDRETNEFAEFDEAKTAFDEAPPAMLRGSGPAPAGEFDDAPTHISDGPPPDGPAFAAPVAAAPPMDAPPMDAPSMDAHIDSQSTRIESNPLDHEETIDRLDPPRPQGKTASRKSKPRFGGVSDETPTIAAGPKARGNTPQPGSLPAARADEAPTRDLANAPRRRQPTLPPPIPARTRQPTGSLEDALRKASSGIGRAASELDNAADSTAAPTASPPSPGPLEVTDAEREPFPYRATPTPFRSRIEELTPVGRDPFSDLSALSNREQDLQWGSLAIGFAAAALLGLLATGLVIALF